MVRAHIYRRLFAVMLPWLIASCLILGCSGSESSPEEYESAPGGADSPGFLAGGSSAGTGGVIASGGALGATESGGSGGSSATGGSNNATGGSEPALPEGPAGFSFSTHEGGTVEVSGTVDIAFGADGEFVYLRQQSKDVSCETSSFDQDPLKGVRKACFTKPSDDAAGQEVKLLEESIITDRGLWFWYEKGKAFHYAPDISPRGDCLAVVNGYIFFGWYKGGMKDRDLMISRKKIGSDKWATVQLPHKHTLIGKDKLWGDSHKTISVGVSEIDGTVHIFYDHHNDPLKYINSKKNIAFAPDSEFKLANFNPTRGNLAPGQDIRITYPEITHTEDGKVIVNYRKGSAVGGNEMVHVYDGSRWSRSKQVTRGGGKPHVEVKDRNYAYGSPYYQSGEVYYAFSVRWARNKAAGFANEGVYLAKTGPTFTDSWEAMDGKKYKLPIQDYSPFLISPITEGSRGSGSSPQVAVTENGGIHIAYRETYSGGGQQGIKKTLLTFTRKAGEKKFTRHEGKMRSGVAWNNKFYDISLDKREGKITILEGEPGSVDYKPVYTLDTDYTLDEYAMYLDEGKLVVVVNELRRTDKKQIYCFVFDLAAKSGG